LRVLVSNKPEMYELIEHDDGSVVLDIMLGEIGWYVMHVPLTGDELGRYREEGESFLRWFIDRVRANPDDYER
jgi:hypothetical protein